MVYQPESRPAGSALPDELTITADPAFASIVTLAELRRAIAATGAGAHDRGMAVGLDAEGLSVHASECSRRDVQALQMLLGPGFTETMSPRRNWAMRPFDGELTIASATGSSTVRVREVAAALQAYRDRMWQLGLWRCRETSADVERKREDAVAALDEALALFCLPPATAHPQLGPARAADYKPLDLPPRGEVMYRNYSAGMTNEEMVGFTAAALAVVVVILVLAASFM